MLLAETMVKAHFVPRKDGPASARKKKKPGWYKNEVPGMGIKGIKKPSEAILAKDPIGRAAWATLESDSSDSDSSDSEEEVKPMFTNLMAQKCEEWRDLANERKEQLETNEKKLRAANCQIRWLKKEKSHSELRLKLEQKEKEQFKAEIGKLKADIDALKAICPICQAEEVVATWVADCGHRVCCDGCVSSMFKCDACPLCREHMIVGNLVRLQGPGAEAGI